LAVDHSSEQEEDEQSLAPYYVFLNSSLNTELVYIILKSISKFGQYSQLNDLMNNEVSEKKNINIDVDDKTGDGLIQID
jgi:hypothetical protein